ncbi:DddA-like double-stranded DNA deaminase toxin [Kutzneria sp. 744]|uniref:DddA-like double-stranded DNA deaminase toxin n=1 Tax=Kutzneria sp. (strain 744) TaxID=345341 RepID=UPI000693EB1F|nr:DddA-like double-stranded DNA deaminase toxin [Kutzneria sp. 744]
MAGAGDDESIRLLVHALAAVDAARDAVLAAADGVQREVSRLDPHASTSNATTSGADTAPAGWAQTPVPPASHHSRPSTELIQQLRDELPPPVVRGSGQKTHGRWVTPDGTAQPLISGRDELTEQVNDVLRRMGCPTLPVVASADVELKLATLMREQGRTNPDMRHLTVVINHRPCRGRLGCEGLLPAVLPEGYTLTVHAPNYQKRFTGGAKPWWR